MDPLSAQEANFIIQNIPVKDLCLIKLLVERQLKDGGEIDIIDLKKMELTERLLRIHNMGIET